MARGTPVACVRAGHGLGREAGELTRPTFIVLAAAPDCSGASTGRRVSTSSTASSVVAGVAGAAAQDVGAVVLVAEGSIAEQRPSAIDRATVATQVAIRSRSAAEGLNRLTHA